MSATATEIRTCARPTCLVCGAAGVVLHTGLRDRLFAVPGTWTMKRCSAGQCGLVWLDPAPLEEDLHLAYAKYYTHTDAKSPLASLANLIFGTGFRCLKFLPAAFTGLTAAQAQIKNMFLHDLPPGRLLDVGCGDGAYLFQMKRAGWTGIGIDFDEGAVAAGRIKYGLNLIQGDFARTEIPASNFDAVTLNHVIEHVPDPIATLKKCGEMLHPGGRLVVTTPNSASVGHQHFGPCWRGLEPPRHLQLFKPDLLAACARRAGLKIIKAASSAARADYVAAASFGIEAAPTEMNNLGGGWPAAQVLKGAVFQFREHRQLQRDPNAGEESVLICERPL